jgi:hypothetical protein
LQGQDDRDGELLTTASAANFGPFMGMMSSGLSDIHQLLKAQAGQIAEQNSRLSDQNKALLAALKSRECLPASRSKQVRRTREGPSSSRIDKGAGRNLTEVDDDDGDDGEDDDGEDDRVDPADPFRNDPARINFLVGC